MPGESTRPDPTHDAAADVLAVRHLGRMRYARAWEIQQETHEQVRHGRAPMTLLIVEHDPVITVSRRKTASGNIVAGEERLAKMGIEVQPTNRGGDVTYHGPGQLVVYPILRLADLGLNLGGYMRWLESVLIEALTRFDVKGVRDTCATGVWVDRTALQSLAAEHDRAIDDEAPDADTCPAPDHLAKVAAIGVRISRQTTLHGIALNVHTDLSHFDTIIPCGLAGRPVTSLAQLLGERCPSMEAVTEAVIDVFRQRVAALVEGE